MKKPNKLDELIPLNTLIKRWQNNELKKTARRKRCSMGAEVRHILENWFTDDRTLKGKKKK